MKLPPTLYACGAPSILTTDDITLLHPGFETLESAVRYRDRLLQSAARLGLGKRVRRVSKCETVHSCGRAACHVCVREARRRFFRDIHDVYRRDPSSSRLFTVGGGWISDLPSFDVRKFRDRLWTRLKRSGASGMPIFGGIEFSFDVTTNGWWVHSHLLVVGDSELLATNLGSSLGKRDLRVDLIKDPVRQLSYALKILPIHHPGARTGARRPRAYPLPDPALAAWISFFGRHEPDDFVFIMGLRRTRSGLVASKGRSAST